MRARGAPARPRSSAGPVVRAGRRGARALDRSTEEAAGLRARCATAKSSGWRTRWIWGPRLRASRLKGGEGRVGQKVVGAPLSHSADVAGRRPPRKTVDLHGFERGARGTVLPAGTSVTRVNPRLLRVYERVRRFRLDSTAGLLGSARPSATRRSCCCQPVSHFQLAAAAEVPEVTIKQVNCAPSS